MKRVLLFLATNLAVIVLLGIILRLIGFEGILDAQGVDLTSARCWYSPPSSASPARSSRSRCPSGPRSA